MRTEYEILLMLDPELPDGRSDEILQRARELVEKSGGSWDRHEPWGRRKLAYEITHKDEGVYHLFELTAEPATLDEARPHASARANDARATRSPSIGSPISVVASDRAAAA